MRPSYDNRRRKGSATPDSLVTSLTKSTGVRTVSSKLASYISIRWVHSLYKCGGYH